METAKQEPNSMFLTSTLILGTRTSAYFTSWKTSKIIILSSYVSYFSILLVFRLVKYAEVRVPNIKVDVRNMEFGSCLAVSKLLYSNGESLLIWWNSIFVLNFSLYIINGVWLLNAKSNGLSSQGLDEYLRIYSKSEDQVDSWLFLGVVVSESSLILQLSSRESLSLVLNLVKKIRSHLEKSRGAINFLFYLIFIYFQGLPRVL